MRKRRKEDGIALLISIFVLLLISVVGIALIVSSGTESALAGNYRSSTGVYYAALAGIEEARGRLSTKNPNSFNSTDAGFLPSPGTTLAIGYVGYVLNPGPTDPADTRTAYPDSEYDTEFGTNALAATTPKLTPSVWNRSPLNSLNVPGPLYKWVRINPVSEKSLQLDVGPAYDGFKDPVTPVFYDGSQLNVTSTGSQVIEITALAVLPNGSQKLLQYLAVPVPITLPPFPAALTLAGSTVSSVVGYSAPGSNPNFWIKGADYDCSGNPNPGPLPVPAIGIFNFSDYYQLTHTTTLNVYGTPVTLTGVPPYPANYTGQATAPSIITVYSFFSPSMQSPAGLDAVAQTLIQNADAIVPTTSGSAQRTFLTNLVTTGAMSSTSPLTVVVNGDLDLTGWNNTGYGLLLVTGTLTYDPDASWNGIVMVVGQGTVIGWKGGGGIFYGAMLVARTRDNTGTLIPGSNLGVSYVDFNHGASMGGQGIRYSNCWIQKSQPTTGYKILTFHEIAQ